jgi:ribosomal protein S18 acetylase RimI-like enzyme
VFEIVLATPADLDDVVLLRQNAREWLRSRKNDQWQKPWPSAEGERERLLQGLENQKTWIVRLSSEPAATFTIDEFSDPQLWTELEQSDRALYVHRFIVHRNYSGIKLGIALMNLIEVLARRGGYQWLRVDVWTSNTELQRYYQDLGFEHVRTIESDYPSGALFQRPVQVHSQSLSPLRSVSALEPRRPQPGRCAECTAQPTLTKLPAYPGRRGKVQSFEP